MMVIFDGQSYGDGGLGDGACRGICGVKRGGEKEGESIKV